MKTALKKLDTCTGTDALLEVASDQSVELSAALRDFEKRFVYPLGQGNSFSIEHGDSYTDFCQAMGPGRCFVNIKGGQVLAAISAAIRKVRGPDGTTCSAAYICDLKTDPDKNDGRALLATMQAAIAWCRPQVEAAYGIVMDGTKIEPTRYTGRLGIPEFDAVGKVAVLQIHLGAADTSASDISTADTNKQPTCASLTNVFETSEAHARENYKRLAKGYQCDLGTTALRSLQVPLWFSSVQASGCLEDTRSAKRLRQNNGAEIVAAHLSNFAYENGAAAAAMVKAGALAARSRGYQCMFVSFPWQDHLSIIAALADMPLSLASATVYAHGISAGSPWFIHSSEI